MIRNFVKPQYLLMGAVVFLAALFAAACGTSIPERSGRMANQNTSKHVKGYQSGGSQAVRFVTPLSGLR